METQLAEVVTKLLEYVEATEGFVVQEAPMVAQEILNRAYFSAGYGIVVGVILLCVAGYCARFASKVYKVFKEGERRETTSLEDAKIGVSSLVAALAGIFGGVSVLVDLYGLLYAILCPRLVIIEYLQGMV